MLKDLCLNKTASIYMFKKYIKVQEYYFVIIVYLIKPIIVLALCALYGPCIFFIISFWGGGGGLSSI